MSKIKEKQKIIFNYKKSNDYKSYHIDGIFGGVLPTTNIWFEIFAEKQGIPEKVICEVDKSTGKLEEIERLPKEGNNEIIREVQSGFTMSLNTARVIRNWLDEKIQSTEIELNKMKK